MKKLKHSRRKELNQLINLFTLSVLVLNMSFLGVFFVAPAVVTAQTVNEPNPILASACETDMVLVMDSSSSMYGTPLQDEKDALKGFVDAFLPSTDTEIAVVSFNNVGEVIQGFTNNATTLKDAIDGVTTTPNEVGSALFTNWHDALVDAHGLYPNRDAPDLIVFASDGNPNKHNDPYEPSGIGKDEATAMSMAITEANAIKSDGIRIIALGIGNSVDENNLVDISGSIVAPPAVVDENADVILSDFSNLATTLATLANELCEPETGTLTICKQEDLNGNGELNEGEPTVTDHLWTFTVEDLGDYTATTTGCATINDIPYDTYTVIEESVAGWIPTGITGSSTGNGIFVDDGITISVTIDNPETTIIYFLNQREDTEPYCGDGEINGEEECDGSNGVPSEGGYYCTSECTLEQESNGGPVCGNGVVESGEQCDDGNNNNGDGCNSSCREESSGGGGGTLFPTDRGGSTPPPPVEPPVVLGETGNPVLTIDKYTTAGIVNPGDTNVPFTVTVINTGNLTAYSAILVDNLPSGLTYSDNGETTKTWELGDILPGESQSVSYEVDVADDADPMVYTNTAEVSASNHNPVVDQASVEIEEVEVLAETGIELNELFMLLLMLSLITVSTILLRQQKQA